MIDLRNRHGVYLPRARGGYLEEAPKEIFVEQGWILEPKEDGLRVSLQTGPQGSIMIGRNRQDFLKGVKQAKEFRDLSYKNPYIASTRCPEELEGCLLDGELTETYRTASPKDTQKLIHHDPHNSALDGEYAWDKYTVARREMNQFVGYVVWDCLFWKGEDIRDRPLWKRRRAAAYLVQALAEPKIKIIPYLHCTRKNLKKLFADGWEGGLAKNVFHPIPAKQRTHTNWWKLKGDKHRTVDAFIIGVTQARSEGSGITGVKPKLNGKAATFTMAMLRGGSNLVVEVGKMKNLPDEVQEEGFKKFNQYKGRVAEMVVSGWDGDRFRWPRFKKWREDKSQDDCRWEEQVNNG